ncbi:amidohydrolase family protein [Bordetella sp. 02P26C-1]|uniref:amidohydrolase family protein n=1 Tax=Bordetella sp. 02P26C-1 TaxID=2683195 RepID=UPI001353ED74|nr:amidohydrolase family protein [Bordetella sp. 02P26C-1]MVW77588.1 amidohydrolase family protein [Bordetella sp. 02P26C-1]
MSDNLYDGPIVDAHHHFWDPLNNPHPWLRPEVNIPFRYGDYNPIKRRYFPEDYLADTARHNVVQSVYIETEWEPTDPIGETRFISALAERAGYPNAVVAQAWLHHAEAHDVLRAQAEFPLVRSVRHKPGGPEAPAEVGHKQTLMSDATWRDGYALLSEVGLHFDLQTPWWNLAEAAQLARDFPDTTILLNHTGLPSDRSEAGLAGWREAMAAFAKCPNVAVKISGIGVRGAPWTVQANRWIVEQVIGLFGVDRVMFASNFPVDGLCATFDTIFTGFKTIVREMPLSAQENLFYHNARRFYRLA